MTPQTHRWTNPSVLAFAADGDPIKAIQTTSEEAVLQAAELGWDGPPFDPFQLAKLRQIRVLPSDDVFDAQTTTTRSGEFQIEYNPNRSHGRIRYSIAHEIAHTFFPDCADTIRHRTPGVVLRDDDWQLELLCNIAAAALLMPTGFADLESEPVNIRNLLRLRKQFDVSTEALFLRIAKLTTYPCAIFAAAKPTEAEEAPYKVNYHVSSRAWNFNIPPNFEVTPGTVMSECTAVGHTAAGTEQWSDGLPVIYVECVGIPPFPGRSLPRVVGVLTPHTQVEPQQAQLRYMFGNALEPKGGGPKIIAHIVNDTTPKWGAGFALAVSRKWKFVQEDFQDWTASDDRNLSLGNIHRTHIGDGLSIVHMIAQQGYGKSARPRIRYTALRQALLQLSEAASRDAATVHLPRIGTGNAGGNWSLIREMIDDIIVRDGVRVTIYDLPESISPPHQGALGL